MHTTGHSTANRDPARVPARVRLVTGEAPDPAAAAPPPGATAAATGLSLLDRLEREWRALATGRLRAKLARWRQVEPALAGFGTLPLLLRFLHCQDADPERKDVLLAALLRLARCDRDAGRVVLEALWPGLKQLGGGFGEDPDLREERWAAIVEAAWERICSYPLERRPARVAANLLLDVRHALRDQRRRELRHSAEPLDDELQAADEREETSDVELLLAQAARTGALTRAEAELILTTRIDSMPLVELAATTGVAYDALRIRRRRAEQRLLLFLGQPHVRFRGSKARLGSARVIGATATGHSQETPTAGRR